MSWLDWLGLSPTDRLYLVEGWLGRRKKESLVSTGLDGGFLGIPTNNSVVRKVKVEWEAEMRSWRLRGGLMSFKTFILTTKGILKIRHMTKWFFFLWGMGNYYLTHLMNFISTTRNSILHPTFTFFFKPTAMGAKGNYTIYIDATSSYSFSTLGFSFRWCWYKTLFNFLNSFYQIFTESFWHIINPYNISFKHIFQMHPATNCSLDFSRLYWMYWNHKRVI